MRDEDLVGRRSRGQAQGMLSPVQPDAGEPDRAGHPGIGEDPSDRCARAHLAELPDGAPEALEVIDRPAPQLVIVGELPAAPSHPLQVAADPRALSHVGRWLPEDLGLGHRPMMAGRYTRGMPLVHPFRGLAYALDRYAVAAPPGRRVADLTKVACPPYDVISPAQQAALLARDPHNAVRLELNPEPDPHAAAARTLAAWRVEGTLERRAAPSAYDYSFARPGAPDDPAVHGVLARVLLEPFGGDVRAHEHTFAGPKADRLALLRATHTQLSPILAIYFDRSDQYRHVMARSWADEWRARDDDGLMHTLAAVEADERLTGFLSGQRLFIADGHHRYETALAHQAEVRADPRLSAAPPGELGADWVMMVLVNAEAEELEIRPTHRLLLEADGEALASLAGGADPLWEAIAVPLHELAQTLTARGDDARPVFGLALPGERAFLLVGDREAVAERMQREPTGTAVRGLDLAILHAVILGDRLGIHLASTDAEDRVAYTRDEAEALAAVTRGAAKAAILVRPTKLEQLAAVANAGEVMPHKSTYFYPKLLTGMVFHSLEDS
jgi:uncharacterized protein (DUF1015 family)